MKTAVEWFYDKIKSHFEHDGDLLETLTFTMAIAKEKERDAMKKYAKEAINELIKYNQTQRNQTILKGGKLKSFEENAYEFMKKNFTNE